MKISRQQYFIFIIICALLLSILNSISFFAGLFNQPQGSIYLGTVHYWEDYFFYLNHFFQGANGAWLTANRFTSETTEPTIIYWTNILMGKIGSIIGLSPILTYNVFLLILAFLMLLLMGAILLRHFRYQAVPAASAFIFATLASSLQNRVTSSEGVRIFWPYQIWKTPHFAFDRLGGAPHQIIQSILFFILSVTIFWDIKNQKIKHLHYIIPSSAGILLATINPAAAAAIYASALVTVLIIKISNRNLAPTIIPKLFISGFFTGLTCIYMLHLMNIQPHIQTKIWEAVNQNATTWPFLAASIGPIIIFILFGLLSGNLQKLNPLEIFGLILFTGAYFMFMSPIPAKVGIGNMRFLFPATYIFLGIWAVHGLDFVSAKARELTGIGKKTAYIGLLGLFILLSLPTNVWELSQRWPKSNSILLYLPEDIYQGFLFLKDQKPPDLVALGNPASHMDSLIPPLSGHTSYSGHMLHTINHPLKQQTAMAFYSGGLPDPEKFLQDNHITYVIFTGYDGTRAEFTTGKKYLSVIYENPGITVYKFNPNSSKLP